MPYRPPRSWIEKTAVSLGLIPGDPSAPRDAQAAHAAGAAAVTASHDPPRGLSVTPLSKFPPPDQWDDVAEFDPSTYSSAPVERHYRLVPTTCFNCESACGLLAYVDRETNQVRKFEGNPLHPASRGRNCAKGPATINQVNDPDRILRPLKRVGPRGGGQWQPVSWDEALADIGGRIRRALVENRRDEIVYHVGRPGAEGYIDRVLRAWGVDGHNSHTNICSSGARLGYALWSGYDRPAPDYANARFILALNAHFESGHYFNPMAQRIAEGLARGAKMAVVDPRLSNTASHASYWLPTIPGSEAALLLAFANVILRDGTYDAAFMERWLNWREFLAEVGRWESGNVGREDAASQAQRATSTEHDLPTFPPSHLPTSLPAAAGDHLPTFPPSHLPTGTGFADFVEALKALYAPFTPEFAERECGIPAATIVTVAREIAAAGSRFCSHTWRGAASAHLGGWQVSRCLQFLHALTGSVGTEGGANPAAWSKYKANLLNVPPPQDHWNELHWPVEFPLAHYEMSFLLPHFLKEGRGRIDVYFTRVFNPVWTYPDGFTWIEALRDESKIGLHVALTPTWNETAFFADYVLPMGHGPERHDLNTYETHTGTWIAFRQPVQRAALRAAGKEVRDTRESNPGEVWEEDEFWIALTWAIDPDGALGIRKWFESPAQPGRMLTVDEYYAHAFERVPGLPEAAGKEGLTPLEYMRKYGAFEIKAREYQRHERPLSEKELEGATIDSATGVVRRGAAAIGVVPGGSQRTGNKDQGTGYGDQGTGGRAVEGFATPSRLLEFYSPTMTEWGWHEYSVPWYIPSHVRAQQRTGSTEQGTEETETGSQEAADRRRETAGTECLTVVAKRGETRERDVAARQPLNPAGVSSDLPTFPPSHVPTADFCLLPTFRLPTLIHTRSGAAKWLNEISQRNPVWIHTRDARRLGVRTGELVRVTTRIGHFVDRCWVTEAIRPGVVACSHHLGRWRRESDPPNSRWSANVVSVSEVEPGKWRLRTLSGPGPFESRDPDSGRIWWREGGVPQNLTFPVQPDPLSGMHCWHQRVTVERAYPGDACGDVFVDTARSMEVYREWMRLTRRPPAHLGLRRPPWLNRPLRPTDAAYALRDAAR